MDFSLFILIGLIIGFTAFYCRSHWCLPLILIYWSTLGISTLVNLSLFSNVSWLWSAHLSLQLTYAFDGLTNLFIILISGIGVLVFYYASIYEKENQERQKLLALLQCFAVSMLAIVVTDNFLFLYCGWEFTSIISYLLIQFQYKDSEANQNAFNGLFITVFGGLCMLVGFIMLAQVSETWSISQTISHFRQYPNSLQHCQSALPLIILGAMTKSAQFPFSFWLAGAMKAPTPVSAYLHSATMVNAGIYLLARLHPMTVDYAWWYPILATVGLSTMMVSGVKCIFQDDLKAFLAQTTVFALGSMVYLLGSHESLAAEALVIFIFFHALYKAGAFMLVGNLDKEYQSKKLSQLTGVLYYRKLPAIAAAILLLSMAGLPPFFGFITKEMIFEAKLAGEKLSYLLICLSMFSSICIAAGSLRCLWILIKPSKNPSPSFQRFYYAYFGPLVLACVIVLMSFYASFFLELLIRSAQAITPKESLTFTSPNEWVSTLLGIITVITGIVLSFIITAIRDKLPILPAVCHCRYLFESMIKSVLNFAQWFTVSTQNRCLYKQVQIVLLTLLLFLTVVNTLPTFKLAAMSSINVVQLIILLLLLGGLVSLFHQQQFINNMISLSLIGIAVIYFFIKQGAPDVTLTLILVEILTVIFLVIAAHKRIFIYPEISRWQRGYDVMVAALLAGYFYLLVTTLTQYSFVSPASDYFISNSWLLAHGANVVNVILVDFRALDTLGEVMVIMGISLVIWYGLSKAKGVLEKSSQ